jgi:hypothetical protein
VRFILTDLRSERYGSSMLGAQQKAWFENECVTARDSHQVIAWISTTTWNGAHPDNWGGYAIERAELANFFRDSLIENMFIICGDAHMLGIDDGTNGDFSTVLFNPFRYPVFNTAALNQAGSYKGGTFSEGGPFLNPSNQYGQFGLVQVIDTGGSSICIHFNGYRTDALGDDILLMNQYSFCRDIGASPVGINTVQNFSASSIYPNPSHGAFIMETGEELDHPTIKIYDISGREMHNDFSYSLSGEHISFMLDEFPAGIYFVNVKTANAVYQKQFVIAK